MSDGGCSSTVPVDALLVALGRSATKGVLEIRSNELIVKVDGREGYLMFPVAGHQFTSTSIRNS
jgi:hypothetical protein